MSVLVDRAIVDSQKTFGIFCSHSENRRDNHPKQRSRTSCCQCSCDSCDVPVPIVADNAVQSAPKLVTSPCPSSSFLNINIRAYPRCLICKRPSRVVRRNPVNRIRMINGSHHTAPSITLMIWSICSNIPLYLHPFA